ncbi:MAG: transporter [Marmoricola sp.]|nr:transporter [Marmoricola sp.]
MSSEPHASRVPLTTLAIPLGLAGLAQVWTLSANGFGTSFVYEEIFWSIVAIAWLVAVVEHARRGRRANESLAQQLAHHTQGPLASLWPLTVMMLGSAVYRTNRTAGVVLTLSALVVAACFGAWILVHWVRGDIALQAVHGGYYVPISAAALVGALTCDVVGFRSLAEGSLVVGVAAWFVTTVVIFLRLARGPSLPEPLVPTLAIMAAPPAIAALAWLAISDGRPDPVFDTMSAVAVLMVLIQIWLLPRYLALPFSIGHWSFTFPAASVAGLGMTWARLEQPPGWRAMAMGLVLVTTTFIGLIAAKSVLLARRSSA